MQVHAGHQSNQLPPPSDGGEQGPASRKPIVAARDIVKRFGGITALDGVSLDFYPGEVHCIVGENGAGKSTLVKIIAGVYRRDGGAISYDGTVHDLKTTTEARSRGTAIVFQEPGIISSLTVAENIFLNEEGRFRLGGFLNTWARNAAAAEALRSVGCERVDVRVRVADLPYEDWKIVELARAAITKDLRVLVVDEATAALGQDGQEMLFAQIRALKQRGIAVIYISHRLHEIFAIGDRITVMKDAKIVTTMPASGCKLEDLPRLMVGRDVSEYYSRTDAGVPGAERGPAVLEVRDLSVGNEVKNVSFSLHRGEILGVAGLVGSGMHALGRALFGAVPYKGTIIVHGKPHTSLTPRKAINLGIGFVPRERDKEALVLLHSIVDNVALPNLRTLVSDRLKIFVSEKKKTALAERYRKELLIRTPSVKLNCAALSGGNRQKVVLAKWLARNVSVLVLACPTRGIDVGAKAEIYALMELLRERGLSVVMISEELPELIGMSDRILVMKEGHISGEVVRDVKVTEEAIAGQML
ncbi:MAG TPA: sugar ABC transporter ATP-binding protein [Rectinemataceae bacterium]|nr:sugar ABC transporter ATP-binding protein [Rectinemataceae bacterium]